MKKKLVDPVTGELVEVWLIGKNPAYRDKGFVKVFYSFLEDVVEDEDIAGKSIRLFLYMLQKLDWNTLEVNIYPEEVVEKLKIHRVTFYKWLEVLLRKDYIEKLRPHRYKLKPYSVVRGSMHKLSEVEVDF